MKIVVSIKQVPDTNEVRLDQATGTLIREGVPSIINPDDKSGLEMALKLKDEQGAHVTVITMGPPQAEAVLKEALAMGADEAVLVTDRAFGGADTWATSSPLASALSKLSYDLIITGRQAIDGDTAQVGPQIAEHLGLPSISYAQSLEVREGCAIVRRQYEDRTHVIKAKLPCLITALGEYNTPRYMTPKGILEAWESGRIRIFNRADLPVAEEDIGLKGSPTRVKKSFTKAVKGQGAVVTLDPEDAANWLIDRLKEKFIL